MLPCQIAHMRAGDENPGVSSQANRSPGAGSRRSKWRIIAPIILLPFVLPSTADALFEAFRLGPYGPHGGVLADPVSTLISAAPTVLWAVGWLFEWSGEYDVLEPRVAVSFAAGLLSMVVCLWDWAIIGFAGLGQALN